MDIKSNVQLLFELRQHQTELQQQNEELSLAYHELDVVRARYFDLFNTAPLGYMIVSHNGIILEINQTAATMLNVSKNVIPGNALHKYIAPADQDIWYHLQNSLRTDGGMRESELRLLRNNYFFWVHFSATLSAFSTTDTVFRIAISDISAAKSTEKALLESENRFHQLAEHDRIFYWECDLNGLITYISPSCLTVLGYSPEEIIGIKHNYDFQPPAEQHRFMNIILTAMSEGKSFHNLESLIQNKEEKLIWVTFNGLPRKDTNGLLNGYRGTIFDINDRKLVQLQQSMFSANAAHQLRTPLTVIHAYSELLAGGLNSLTDASDYGQMILSSCERMERTISALLLLTKLDCAQHTLIPQNECDINALLYAQLAEIGAPYYNKALVIKIITEKSAIVRSCSAALLSQIFHNLIENAMKYTPKSGSICISLAVDRDNSVVFSVSDSGAGIAENDLPFIFDRFFRTQSSYGIESGSGLGLSIVRQIVEFLRGSINVESTLGKGSKFTVTLPAIRQ